MPVYQQIPLATNLSQYVTSVQGQQEAMMLLERGTAEPSVFVGPGRLWNRSDFPYSSGAADAIMWHNGTAWAFLLDPRHGQINAGGTVSFTGPQSMGGQKLTDLAAGTADNDATRKVQQLLRDGSQAATGNLPMGGNRITGLGAPSAPADAARYQDAQTTIYLETTSGERIDSLDGSGFPFTFAGVATPRHELLFLPEVIELVIRARVRDADDGDENNNDLSLIARIPRSRHHTTASGFHDIVAGWFHPGSSGPWQILTGRYNNAQKANYDWRSDVIPGDQGDFRLYVKFFADAAPNRGVSFWFQRESGQYQYLDEFGSGSTPDVPVVQMWVHGQSD